MKIAFPITLFLTFTLLLPPAATPSARANAQEFDPSGWTWCAGVEPEGEPEHGLIEFKITPGVYDLSRPDLADLRVLAGERILPWIARRPTGTRREVRLETRLYNRTHIPGEYNRITVDFGDRVMKDSLRVETPGENFKRGVLVEASRDTENWETLVGEAFLFDASSGPDRRFRKDRIGLPQNDFRYLRLTIDHDPDDPGDVPITRVDAWRREGEPPPLETVPVIESAVEDDARENRTLITLDLGHRNLPLHRVTFDFEDSNFHRYFTIWGRNSETRTVTRRIEDGAQRQVTLEQPWHRIAGGHIHRYSAGGGTDESLSVTFGPHAPRLVGMLHGIAYDPAGPDHAGFRYIQVRIHNGDNPPLSFLQADALCYMTYIAFPPHRPGPYRLFFGNPEAPTPDYDLMHYAGRLRSEGIASARLLGPERAPEAVADQLPFSERYGWVLGAALLGAVAAVGWMLWRQVRGAAVPP